MQSVNAASGKVLEGSVTASAENADPDAVVVERVRQGDIAAFDTLVRKYRERLFSVVYNITGNREDSADLTQDAFIRAFQSLSRFRGNASFFTWLYRIAVNASLTHMRKNRLRRFFSFEQIDEETVPADLLEALVSRSRSDKPTLLKELQEKLNEALHSLSIKHRTVVVLYEIEGLDHAEIATIMKCSVGTVRSRLHYAKQQLQTLLQDYLQ